MSAIIQGYAQRNPKIVLAIFVLQFIFLSTQHAFILPLKTSLVVTAATTRCLLSRTVSATAASARQPHNRLSGTVKRYTEYPIAALH
jgi:hypothetical protein